MLLVGACLTRVVVDLVALRATEERVDIDLIITCLKYESRKVVPRKIYESAPQSACYSVINMDQETKQELADIKLQIQLLTTAVADGFSKITNETHSEFVKLGARVATKADFSEFNEQVKSIRSELESIPNEIDQTYGKSFNELFDRVSILEKKDRKSVV